MDQTEQMRRLGYRYIGHGFLHNIYEKDGLIYKCLRGGCPGRPYHKFEHERACMDLLRERGIPTVRVLDIVRDGILPGVCFLVEEKARGVNYAKETMPGALREAFFAYLMGIAQIEMPFWGDTRPDGRKTENGWIPFLASYIKGLDGLPPDVRQGLSEEGLIRRLEEAVPGDVTPHFLVMDANPENFFWDERGEVCSVIDIDHPICGDPLFQAASIRYEWGDLASGFLDRQVSGQERERLSLYETLILCNDILLEQRLNRNGGRTPDADG